MNGNPNRARDFFNRRLAKDPDDASALNGLGLLSSREMSYAQAKKLLLRASELNPGSDQFLTDLGDLALKVRQPQEAISHYEAALKKNKRNLLATLGLARCYELTERNSEANTLYERALGYAGKDYPPAKELAGLFFGKIGQEAKGHYLMSSFYEETGRLKEAMFHCEAAVKAPKGQAYKADCERKQRDLKELMDKKI
jgi:tetratricopeptide (TPR) repeat protein